jgi:predicted nucleotidyltransferase
VTLTPAQVAALREVDAVFRSRPVVVIGATALGFYYDMSWRKTADVDLAIAVELDEFPLGLTDRVGWKPGRYEHEFISPLGVKLDILPAGPKLVAAGVLRWPSGHTMNLEGFDLAFSEAVPHETTDDYAVLVAPPPVVAVLKMAAYLDRPADRGRDLTDLGHLLDSYIDDESARWFTEGADAGEYELVPAYVLGLDVARVAKAAHAALVERFLEAVGDPDAPVHAEMERRGPARWRTEKRALERRLDAFTRAWRRQD